MLFWIAVDGDVEIIMLDAPLIAALLLKCILGSDSAHDFDTVPC